MKIRPRVGFHDFLNSKPLLYPFRHGLLETPFELIIDTPSRLADRFHEGDLDMALIPSIEYAMSEDAVIVPAVCIASLGPVETVVLFSEMAMEDMESVLVDPKSRSSVAMLRILFKEMYNREPAMITGGEESPADMLRSADGGLVIGDAAFSIDREKYVVYDLGELWFRRTGRPFVHAVLCSRRGRRWDKAVAAIEEAKSIGLRERELIARQEGRDHREADAILDYLTKRIIYDLGEEERDGLSAFLGKAEDMGLARRAGLEFY
ncbi:MAG: menaquinone biosynthetic enzyme MqnA/MqnD family protein [Candidatus Nitrospinota bacterium M3_3B_026]